MTSKTRYNELIKQASQTPKHEPQDDEITINSSVNLKPHTTLTTESQESLDLKTVIQSITRLLQESKTAQEWYIHEINTRGINLERQSNFTGEYARKTIPSPPDGKVYTPGTIGLSRRIIADKAEAYRIMQPWQERRDIYNELQDYPEDVTYETYKEASGRTYLKRNLFKNIRKMKRAPELPEVKKPRLPLGKTDKQYTLIAISGQDILLCGIPLKLNPASDEETRVDLLFRLPDRYMRNHNRAVHVKLTRPTIYLDDHGEPTFAWAIQESCPPPDVRARDAESCVGVDCGKTNRVAIARVHRDGRYTGGLGESKRTSRESKRSLDKRQRELDRNYAKQARREALVGEGNTTLSPERAAAREAHMEELRRARDHAQSSYEWDLVADVMTFAQPGEPVVVEDLKFNEGGSLHFRFSGFQSKLEHRCKLTGHDFVRVPAGGTSANCPDCLRRLGDRDDYHWTVCEACGWEGDRDASSAVAIARRGLKLGRGVRLDRAHEVQKRSHKLAPVRRGPKAPARPARGIPKRCDRKGLPVAPCFNSFDSLVRGPLVGGASAGSTGGVEAAARFVGPGVGSTDAVVTRLCRLLR